MNLQNKSEFVYREIAQKILAKEYTPGQRLVERTLIKEFGVSKTPIREAVQRLRQDGLLSGDFYHGVQVTRLTKKEALELLDTLEILVCETTKKAAVRVSDEDLEDIRKLFKKFEEFLESGDINAYAETDIEFHDRIAQCADNRFLLNALRRTRLVERLLLTTTAYLPGRGPHNSIKEHREIMDALNRRDPKAAFNAARKNILSSRNAIEKYDALP